MSLWEIVLLILLVIAGICLIESEFEKNRLTTKEYVVESEKLPEAFDGFRIAFLSDLHEKRFGQENERLVNEVKKTQPDLILFGGDMLTVKGKRQPDDRPFAELLEPLKDLCPMAAVTGNHENRLVLERGLHPGQREKLDHFYATYGVRELQNEKVTLIHESGRTVFSEEERNEGISLYGLDFPPEYYLHGKKKPLEEGLIENIAGKKKDGFIIVLTHMPSYQKELTEWGADLVLSGHNHGGTIVLPYLGGVMTPQYRFFVKEARGRQDFIKGSGIVSAGLGTHSINVRLNDPPEVVLIKLKKKG